MAGQTIQVSVLADTRKFSSAMKRLGDDTGFNKLTDSVKAIGKALVVTTAAAAAAAFAFGKVAVDAASDLQQSMGAVDAVFKDQAGTVHAWAASAARDLGLSKNQYNEFATVVGSQLKNMGVPFEQVTRQTNDLISKGADLAAQFGGTTADAVSALSALMRGESDPIERYGVSIKEADINAQMLADGTSKLEGEQGKLARTQAILTLLNKQTADSQGAFGRESNTLAGQQQRLAAQFENLKATLGTYLLPVITKVTGWVSDNMEPAFERLSAVVRDEVIPRAREFGDYLTGTVVPALRGFGQWVQDNVSWLGPLASAIAGAVTAFMTIQKVVAVIAAVKVAMTGFKAAWLALNATFVMSPIGLLIVGITALVAALVWFFTQTDTGQKIVKAAWNGIKTAVSAVVDWFQNTVQPVLERVWSAITTAAQAVADWYMQNVAPVFAAFGELLSAIFNRIATIVSWLWTNVFQPYLQFILSGWQLLWAGVQAVWEKIGPPIMTAIGVAINVMQTVWTGVWNAVKTIFTGVWNAIRIVVETVLGVIKGVINTATNVIKGNWTGAWNSIRDTINTVWNGIRQGVQNGIDTVRNLVGSIRGTIPGVLSGAGDWLVQTGRNLLVGLWNGISDKVGWVKDKISGVGSSIINSVKGVFGIHSPSRVFKGIGGNLMDGLAIGIRDLAGVNSAISLATNTVEAGFDPMLQLNGSAAGGASASNTYNITVQTGVGDPVEIGRTITTYLQKYERVNGGQRA